MSTADVDDQVVLDVDLDAVVPCEIDICKQPGAAATMRLPLRPPCGCPTSSMLACGDCARRTVVFWAQLVAFSRARPIQCKGCWRWSVLSETDLTATLLGARS